KENLIRPIDIPIQKGVTDQLVQCIVAANILLDRQKPPTSVEAGGSVNAPRLLETRLYFSHRCGQSRKRAQSDTSNLPCLESTTALDTQRFQHAFAAGAARGADGKDSLHPATIQKHAIIGSRSYSGRGYRC